jgi:hypothetical protein
MKKIIANTVARRLSGFDMNARRKGIADIPARLRGLVLTGATGDGTAAAPVVVTYSTGGAGGLDDRGGAGGFSTKSGRSLSEMPILRR